MTLTATQLITNALKDLRVLGVGRSLSAEDAASALVYLQEMIDSWAADKLTIYTVARTSYTLTADEENRTIGPTGDFTAVRPVWISSATVKEVGSDLEIPVDIWDRNRWLYEPLKTQENTIPTALYMEPTNPDATLHFWPVPTTAATLVLGVPTALVAFANLTTSYEFPPGYGEALRTCLVRKLARPFGRPLTADIVQDADDAMARIKRLNLVGADGPTAVSVDEGLIGGVGDFDIALGDYRRRQ